MFMQTHQADVGVPPAGTFGAMDKKPSCATGIKLCRGAGRVAELLLLVCDTPSSNATQGGVQEMALGNLPKCPIRKCLAWHFRKREAAPAEQKACYVPDQSSSRPLKPNHS